MKIIVAGCGKIGSAIISSLTAEGHDVVAIDKNEIELSNVTNVYDVMGVCGNSADCDVLEEAGVKGTQLFVAATDSDDTNMLCCFIAKKMGAEHTIARIRNPEYNDRSLGFMRQQLELSMAINPELLVAEELFRILKLPMALRIESFSRRTLEMIEIRLKEDSPLNGICISKVREKFDANFLICAVQREEEVFIPDGSFELQKGDLIGFVASKNEVARLFKMLGAVQKQAKNVMILGGSRTSYYLAKMLCNSGNSVKIIEQDPQKCQELAALLPKAVIVEADGAKQEILMEEGIGNEDAFVSLTGVDEENILLSLFAATKNVPKVIAKISREELS
ncbi:MAG: Trk system potassium transporter TrkA, partial [Clostridia bacterium]|nr:Trk system potassium transporter TrkA [Clostridia bacterium]